MICILQNTGVQIIDVGTQIQNLYIILLCVLLYYSPMCSACPMCSLKQACKDILSHVMELK